MSLCDEPQKCTPADRKGKVFSGGPRTLILDQPRPVDEEGERGRPLVRREAVDQKAFAVGRDVVGGSERWMYGKERRLRAGVEARRRLHRHRHDLVVEGEVEELLAVASPAGIRAARSG